MGQAKKRGTFEERLAKALVRKVPPSMVSPIAELRHSTQQLPRVRRPVAGASILVLAALTASLGTNKR